MEMESGDQMAKKARMELLNQVKQEVAVGETNGGGGAVVAAEVEDASRVDITLKFDMALLHCHVCVLPLKPPVFQCEAAGHVACASCHGKLPRKRCHTCSNGRAYIRCPAMDNVVSAARIPCPYDQHGCRSYVAYHDLGIHQSLCPYAPCSCTEPGCVFVGPPAVLLGHLTTVHSWPVHNIHYGKALRLGVPASRRRVLLVEKDSGGMFLLAVGELGPARAVSLVCVRANAGAGPSYTGKLWAHSPQDAATGKSAFILMDSTVMSSAAPGEILMDEVKFLAVPPVMLHGAEPSKEMHLSVRIDKTS